MANKLPSFTNGTQHCPKGNHGARWCVPADTVTKLLHSNAIKTVKSSILQFSIVRRANLMCNAIVVQSCERHNKGQQRYLLSNCSCIHERLNGLKMTKQICDTQSQHWCTSPYCFACQVSGLCLCRPSQNLRLALREFS